MAIASADMDHELLSIAARINELAVQGDGPGSQKIQDFLIKLQQSLETPWETLMRYYDLDFQHCATRIGCDMKIFTSLAASDAPLTLKDLARVNGASEVLLGRIMRYLAASNMIDEVDIDTFAANKITRTLALPDFEGGVRLSFDVQRRTNSALPELLMEKGFQTIQSATDTAFNKAWNTGEPFFTWIRSQPKLFEHLRHALDVQFREDWLNTFRVEDYLGNFAANDDPSKVLLVDVGGSLGIQCRGFRQKYSKLLGRVILEDLQETVDVVPPIEGVEVLAQDYLTEQAVKGAKFYYYRNIFHDNPDERVRLILDGLRPAMGSESLLLIDDKVLPNRGIHRRVTMLDLAMMAQVASHERTLDQWRALLHSADWKIRDIVTYSQEYDAVLVVEKA